MKMYFNETYVFQNSPVQPLAAAPPVYQWQHQHENVYKSRRLDLFNLSTVSREFSNYQVVSLKKIVPFLQSTYS
jgi:hypothetical protein